jgi:hypothetical protein
VIRGEINSSRSLARVSLPANLTFRALLNAVDDFGRFEADPLVLKATLFLRQADVTPEMVRGWVEELAGEGCARVYAVDGIEFLVLTGWEKHRGEGRRAKKSRFPAPPELSSVSEDAHGDPGTSQEILGSAGEPQEILPGVGGRGTCSEGRVAGSVGRSEHPPAPKVPTGGAAEPAPRWNPLVNLLGPCGADPPPEPDEKAAWLEVYLPEIEASADAELPDDPTGQQRGKRVKSIAMARWRAYLTKTPRQLRGAAAAADLERRKREWDDAHRAEHDAELAEAGSL